MHEKIHKRMRQFHEQVLTRRVHLRRDPDDHRLYRGNAGIGREPAADGNGVG